MVTKVKEHSEFQYWCPRVHKNKKWKYSLAGNRSDHQTHAGQPANKVQVGRHWLAGNSYFPHGDFHFLVFWTLGHQYWNFEWSFALVTTFYLNLFWRGVTGISSEGKISWVCGNDKKVACQGPLSQRFTRFRWTSQ